MPRWRNENEKAYLDGKKHFIDVIKNVEDTDIILWRQPQEDFNCNSTLIVMPGETAIFVNCGRIERVFEPGRYKLSTENYPFVGRLRNALSGGVSTFNCVVYFARTATTSQIDWGTRVAVRDPAHGIQTDLAMGGAYRLRTAQPEMLLAHLAGSSIRAFKIENVKSFLGSEYTAQIKSCVVSAIQASGDEILGIEKYLVQFSQYILMLIKPFFLEYGMELLSFTIDRMGIVDSEVRNELEKVFGTKTEMVHLGDDWARIKAGDILTALASNPNAGGIAAMGAGLGMGMAAAPIFSTLAQQLMTPSALSSNPLQIQQSAPKKSSYRQINTVDKSHTRDLNCMQCGTVNAPNANFCSNCGKPIHESSMVCMRCGAQNESASKFCSNCGNSLI